MGMAGFRQAPMAWLLAGLIALSIVGTLAFYRPFQSEARGATPGQEARTTPAPPPLPGKRTTFLVMGVDRRPGDAGRADSMMVVSVNTATSQVSVISLARDTFAQIPGHGFDKINHAYAYGGEGLAIQVVERLLGIPIDHYVTLSFQGFQQLIDELGGVHIDVEKRMLYHDPDDLSMGPDGLVIDISPGPQLMDGLTALKYSRFRMDEEGDLGRMRRQQQLMQAMVKSASRPAILARLPQLIPAIAKSVITDLSVAEMFRLAASAKEAMNTPLRTGTFGGEPRFIGGVYYLVPDLMNHRAAAYETLVGSRPSDTFLRRSREDQATYTQALADMIAQAEASAANATEAAEAAQKEQAVADRRSQSDDSSPAPSGGTAGGSQPEPAPKAPTAAAKAPATVTVAVIDASGKSLGPNYVLKLRSAGFKVTRIGRTSRPVEKTVAIDHAGLDDLSDRLRAILPRVVVVSVPDADASEMIEIILGADLQ